MSSLEQPQAVGLFCLSMIFRNEGPRIARAIASVRPLLGAYELSDTGSIDDSRAQAETALAGLSGAIHVDRWYDFSHNRNLSLERARKHEMPILFLDCDDEIVIGCEEQAQEWDVLTAWAFDGPLRHRRVLAVNPHAPTFWDGSLHEQLTWVSAFVPKCVHSNYLGIRYRHDGDRHQNGNETTERDIELLQAVQKGCASYDRSQYYLARTLHHAGEAQRAITVYKQYLATHETSDETTFHANWSLAALTEAVDGSTEEILAYLEIATASRPSRVEPVIMAARVLREAGYVARAFNICSDALAHAGNIPDDDFVDVSYYGWRLYDEMATLAILICSPDVGRQCIAKALRSPFLPNLDRDRLVENLSLIENVTLL